MAMQLNAYTAISEEIEEQTVGEELAEAVQLAYAATNTYSQTKGKGKGKDKSSKGKSGGKVVKSKLTIADRKAKLTELKSKSRCFRCGVLKAMLRKTVQETLPSNIEEMETVLSECVTAKNELARHQGFSPAQHVLGKQPRIPGSC